MFTCRNQLARVFDMIYDVNLLDSRDSANLQLLGRPDLSVTFTKFHCWRLTMFEKAVFLDADTLVIACTYVKVSLFFSNSLNNHEVRLQTHMYMCQLCTNYIYPRIKWHNNSFIFPYWEEMKFCMNFMISESLNKFHFPATGKNLFCCI